MNLLLDTHALIWWVAGDTRLPGKARDAILDSNTQTYVSAVSAMEIVTKHRLGRLPQAEILARSFEDELQEHGFAPLPLTVAQSVMAGRFPFQHGDPFDRLLIAQAMLEGLTLVSNERLFDSFGVSRLW